ncbi:MAG: sulfite exporter TauE/SafE family protein, partial [Cryobacterium sp.]|nr:sulfite exporter TauE/SafE family protein [Cryobacterium sp.]
MTWSRDRILRLVLIGLVVGFFSGLFGVGGGIVLVPLLISFAGFDHRQASATSLAAVLLTAIAGMVAYASHGSVDLI